MKIVNGKDGQKYIEGSIDYNTCLEAAGAEVLEYQSFGDYQGTWFAVLRVDQKVFLVSGSYGSCSGCDALEGELDSAWDINGECTHGYLYDNVVKFGKPYLDNPIDIDKEIELSTDDSSWDCESEETVKWLKEMKAKYFAGGKS